MFDSLLHNAQKCIHSMSVTIDIVTTATARPEIFKETLRSFYFGLFLPAEPHIKIRHIINIDRVGCDKANMEAAIVNMRDCVDWAEDTRRNKAPCHTVIHEAHPGNFPRAFKFLWDAVGPDTDFVFHLEDDWRLLHPVSLSNMLRIMRKYPTLAALRLSAFKSEHTREKNWNLFLPWNGVFFEMPEELRHLGISGHPSLIRGEFVRAVRPYLDGVSNPEKQIHSVIGGKTPLGAQLRRMQYGVYHSQDSGPDIQDTGREWMKKAGYKKSGAKAVFTHWEAE